MQNISNISRAILVMVFTCSAIIVAAAQEEQVPFDNEGKIMVVDHAIDQKLNLFSDRDGFSEARLYNNTDGSFVIEMYQTVGGRFFRTRLPRSASEIAEMRKLIASRGITGRPDGAADVHTPVPLTITPVISHDAVLDQSGRTELIMWSTLYSLGFYGWAMTDAMNITDTRPYIASYGLIGGGGILLPFFLTKNVEVTDGESNLASSFAAFGIGQGFMLGGAVDADRFTTKALASLTSIGAGAAGYFIARNNHMSSSHASVIRLGGALGWGQGLGLGYVLNGDKMSLSTASSYGLAGSVVGYIAGNALANAEPAADLDATALGGYASLGTLFPLTVLAIGHANMGTQTTTAVAMGGNLAGTYIGHRMIRDGSLSAGNGAIVTLCTAGGSLVGIGLAYVLAVRDAVPYALLSSAGMIAGFEVSYNSLMKTTVHESSNWDVHMNPLGIASAFSDRNFGGAPIISVSGKW